VPVPQFHEFCLPVLKALAGTKGASSKSALLGAVPEIIGMQTADLSVTIPSGQTAVENRIGWALSYMKKVGWVGNPKRGQWLITPAGTLRLNSGKSVSPKELHSADEDDPPIGGPSPAPEQLTPHERIDAARKEILTDAADTVLERLKAVSPSRFEAIVLQVLSAMGYVGDQGHTEHVGKSNDGGIDGVLYLDRLGLERIYVQAKRWQGAVGAPVVREFAGTMDGEGAAKGVILTTASFTQEARKFLSKSTKTIRLVDGFELARLMVEFEVGVTIAQVVKVPRVDEDYFEPN